MSDPVKCYSLEKKMEFEVIPGEAGSGKIHPEPPRGGTTTPPHRHASLALIITLKS